MNLRPQPIPRWASCSAKIDIICNKGKSALPRPCSWGSIFVVFPVQHMTKLHTEVAKLIEKYRQEKGEPPESIKTVYDYLHRKQIDKAAEVKTLQGMYPGT